MNSTAFSSSGHLFLYREQLFSASCEAYGVKWLREQLQIPMRKVTAPPSFRRDFNFRGERPIIDTLWESTCSRLWDGRYGVFSRCSADRMWGIDYVTMGIVDEESSNDGYDSIILHLAHWIKDGSIRISPSGWDVWGIGGSGKTILWMESYSAKRKGKFRTISFAEFPSSRSILAPSQMDRSSLASSPVEGGDTNLDIHTSQEWVPEGDNEDNNSFWEIFPPSPAFNPITFGNICEYTIPDSWDQEYGDIYTIDFDDARGRLALATSSGKILILEFI
jgi:hypothetical protein